MPSDHDSAGASGARASRPAGGRVTAEVDVDPAIQRLVIVSDLHGYKEPLDALDQWLDQLPEPCLVFVNGDIFEGGIDGQFALEWTMRRAAGRTTRGNHDSAIFEFLDGEPSQTDRPAADTELSAYRQLSADQLAFVKSLPDVLNVRWRGHTLRLMHGHFNLRTPDATNWRLTPSELTERFGDPAVDLTVIGHTHYPFVSHSADGAVANPGSVAAPLFRYLNEAGQEIDRRADDPNLSVDDTRPSFLSVTEIGGKLRPTIERFDYDRAKLLERHAAEGNVRLPLEIRRAWIMDAQAPAPRRRRSER